MGKMGVVNGGYMLRPTNNLGRIRTRSDIGRGLFLILVPN